MALSPSVDTIAKQCGVPLETGRTLAEFTTIGVGGPVRWILRPDSLEALGKLLSSFKQSGCRFRVVGGGANLIAGPGPFEEPIILTRGIKHGPIFEGNRVRAGCGVVMKRLGRLCAEQGLGGLEFAEGIPGTVGGTVYMNAGSFGGQMSDVVREVTLFDPGGNLQCQSVCPEDFSYRRSPFQQGALIVEVVFELEATDPEALKTRLREVSEKRSSSQPPGERSAGCIFKNPPGDSAGRLIDKLGMKGLSVGGASISEVHGNFIVNRGDATSADVLSLIEMVKKRVSQEAGVTLQEEVIIWE